jgi:dCMP deaminase
LKDLSTHKIEYFRKITKAVASGSRCLSRQVGAVIVKDKRILATGYNGLPAGFNHCSVCYGGERVSGHGLDKLPCIHAEENALIQCAKYGTACDNCVMFVTTMPCNVCLKKIIGAGIRKVYVLEPYYLDHEGEKLRQDLLSEAKDVMGFHMILLPQIGG